MSDIDNLLATVGLQENPSNTQEESSTTPIQPLSTEAFEEVLNEMGFGVVEPEYDEQAGEGHIEAVEATYADSASTQNIYTIDGHPMETVDHAETDIASVLPANYIGQAVRDLVEQEDTVSTDTLITSEPIPVEEPPVVDEDYIAPNSPTLLVDATTSRFSGTEWYNEIQKKDVILAGLGGIGSYVAFQLARMNIHGLVLYDDDVVEPANMSGQFYGNSDINWLKVDAMVDTISNYTSMRSILGISQKFTEETEAGDIMICGFDNMAARKTFFNAWLWLVQSKPEEERKNCLYIDGRLSVDMFQVLCIRGDDAYNISIYQNEFLFSDAEAEATVCSLKQTTYLACMIGSVMVNLFTNWVAGLLDPTIPYDLPFFTSYEAQNMIFKTRD